MMQGHELVEEYQIYRSFRTNCQAWVRKFVNRICIDGAETEIVRIKFPPPIPGAPTTQEIESEELEELEYDPILVISHSSDKSAS